MGCSVAILVHVRPERLAVSGARLLHVFVRELGPARYYISDVDATCVLLDRKDPPNPNPIFPSQERIGKMINDASAGFKRSFRGLVVLRAPRVLGSVCLHKT